MKKMLALTGASLCMILFVSAKTGTDDIIGVWIDASGQAQLRIYKEGNKYFGKIVWLKVPNNPKTGSPKLDFNNPDKQLQSKPLIGLQILRDFVYDKGEWNSGRIYDPTNGKDYKCYMKLKDANTLSMRGYIGFSLLGRTEIWIRVRS